MVIYSSIHSSVRGEIRIENSLIEVQLPYELSFSSVGWLDDRLVGRSVGLPLFPKKAGGYISVPARLTFILLRHYQVDLRNIRSKLQTISLIIGQGIDFIYIIP